MCSCGLKVTTVQKRGLTRKSLREPEYVFVSGWYPQVLAAYSLPCVAFAHARKKNSARRALLALDATRRGLSRAR
eukprot:scaffold27703_cov75-Phaeocystis_antarctica.AAC.7